VTLTVAGIAMGMLLPVASGLSLTFGLMDVLNFAHGRCSGAFAGFSVVAVLTGGWAGRRCCLLSRAWVSS
jgi:branched-chain amino acid transport system permease protein